MQDTNIELNELYQEIIIDHARRPRFKGRPHECCRFCQEGKNPLCGDNITIYCRVDEETTGVKPKIFVSFEGSGCSISQASASMMCESVQGVSVLDAKRILSHAEEIYSGKVQIQKEELDADLESLAGVSKFPVRVKCAALAWKSLELLIATHFDDKGEIKAQCPYGTDNQNCPAIRKLKVVQPENNN